jgi:hypothetical protein
LIRLKKRASIIRMEIMSQQVMVRNQLKFPVCLRILVAIRYLQTERVLGIRGVALPYKNNSAANQSSALLADPFNCKSNSKAITTPLPFKPESNKSNFYLKSCDRARYRRPAVWLLDSTNLRIII